MSAVEETTERSVGWPPTRLILEFGPRVTQGEHSQTHSGHCGYEGKGSQGFDDGSDFFEQLTDSGWRQIAAGEWPYLQYLWWAARDGSAGADGQHCIASYQERDFSIEVFDGYHAASAAAMVLVARRPLR